MGNYTLTGIVTKVYPAEQKSEKFRVRELVVKDESNPQYPEYAVFQFANDKCDLLDKYAPGDTVTVHFNVKGRAYQKGIDPVKYFSNLAGWKVEGTGTATGKPSNTAGSPVSPADDDDDLPF